MRSRRLWDTALHNLTFWRVQAGFLLLFVVMAAFPFGEHLFGTVVGLSDLVVFVVWPTATVAYVLGRPSNLSLALRQVSNEDGEFVLPITPHDGPLADSLLSTELVRLDATGSIGLLGATRSGKTEALKILAYQMLLDRQDTPIVVYDHKSELRHWFRDTLDEDDVVVLSADKSVSTHTWNLFGEVESYRDAREIARLLSPDDGHPFFSKASQGILAGCIWYVHREAQTQGKRATNEHLLNFIRTLDVEQVEQMAGAYTALESLTTYVSEDSHKQSAAVLATTLTYVEEVLEGDFGAQGRFSLAEFFDNPRGRVLIIDYDGLETTKPAIRCLLDRSIAHAMDDNRPARLLLDEFAQVPRLSRLDELVNVGAGRDVQSVLALQSVSQLYDVYGREKGTAVVSGLRSQILLRTDDTESKDFVREAIGTEWQEREQLDYDDDGEVKGTESERVEKHAFARGELSNFAPGEAVVVKPRGWLHAQIKMLGDVREDFDHGLDRGVDGTDQDLGHAVDDDGTWRIPDDELDELG